MTDKKFKDNHFTSVVKKVGGAVGLIFSVSECKTHDIKLGKRMNLDDAYIMKDDGDNEDGKIQ